MWIFIFIILLRILLRTVNCKLITSDTIYTSYNALAWNVPIQNKTFEFVNILSLSNNPCDVDSFTTKTQNKVGWVDLVEVEELCKTIPFHFWYSHNIAELGEKIELSGTVLLNSMAPEFDKVWIPPNVDIQEKKVNGRKINLFCISAEGPQPFSKNSSIISISYDPNPFDVLFSPTSWFRFAQWIHGLLNVTLLCYVFKNIGKIKKEYAKTKDQNILFLKYYLIIPECIGTFCKIISQIDALGMWYVFDFITIRILDKISASMVSLTDIVNIIYCVIVYKIFMHSRKLKSYKPNFTLIKVFLITYTIISTFLNVLISYQHLNGDWVFLSSSLPLILIFMVFFTTSVILSVLCFQLHSVLRNVTTTHSFKKLRNIFKLRNSIFIIILNRIIICLGMILNMIGLVYSTPFWYVMVNFVFLNVTPLIGSFIQLYLILNVRSTIKIQSSSKSGSIFPLILIKKN